MQNGTAQITTHTRGWDLEHACSGACMCARNAAAPPAEQPTLPPPTDSYGG